MKDKQEQLFKSKLVPGKEGSGILFEEEFVADNSPVECLGMTFENDEARRDHFLSLLREGLEELHAKLGGMSFTTVEDAVERMKSVEEWPMGDDVRLRELAERMQQRVQNSRLKIQNSAKSDSILNLESSNFELLQLWKDEVGFPHGEIKDILNLSDPPYYTACSNPFIADFIKHYGKSYDPNVPYSKEPFAADVSEGKNDPIYNAHSYHTKVPHKAIMRYILHYTEPGDVVFDGFCGTGMTGVAAQLCGDCKTVESLGYKVDDQGIIYQQETDENGKTVWMPFSKLGTRRAILNDLSPAATFIAHNYNTPVDVQAFEVEAKRILKEVEEECGWMYATLASPEEGEPEAWADKLRACKTADEIRELFNLINLNNSGLGTGPTWGRINYTVWSDVFVCPECTHEVVFWESAVDKEEGKVNDDFLCPHCGRWVSKSPANPKKEAKKPVNQRRPESSRLERAWMTKYDKAIGQTVHQAKQVLVLINYSVGKKRFEKTPDALDLVLIEKIEQLDIPYWFPTNRIPEGDKTGEPLRIGITHVHHFYTKRNLWVLGACIHNCRSIFNPRLILWVTASMIRTTKMYKFTMDRKMGTVSGTLYIPSLWTENGAFKLLRSKIKDIKKAGSVSESNVTFCQSLEHTTIPKDNIAYIFTDPPFGGNLMYSELNFLWETWLKVFTNNKPEAITNKVQGKGLPEYHHLMFECFKEYYRALKPGCWMTVEFHNSQNRIYHSIQEGLQMAGFVIADVRTLDKKQGSFNQVTQAGAVKQDIIISCYKPNHGLEERFKLTAGTGEGVWDFVCTHLKQLPIFVSKDGKAEVIAERQNYLLYDRMIAFHVQRHILVPMGSAEFYASLAQRFPERDGMYFLLEQVAEYDKKRMKVKEVLQLSIFVTDEASAIQWLKQQLTRKPQTFQELHPQFLKEIGGWQKHEKPLELAELLEENFLRYDGKGEVPSQIHSYLSSNFKELRNLPKDDERLRAKAKDRWYVPDPNKAGDLEKLRERTLLREFEEYRGVGAHSHAPKRLKVFRLEAVRAGFKKAWQERDYATIIAVARKIREKILQEDPKLLMWYDQALTRSGGE